VSQLTIVQRFGLASLVVLALSSSGFKTARASLQEKPPNQNDAGAQLPKPLTRLDVMGLLAAHTRLDYLERLIQIQGVDFLTDEDFAGLLKLAGAGDVALLSPSNAREHTIIENPAERDALLHLAHCSASSRNATFGDPECSAALPLFPDEPAVLLAAARGNAFSFVTAETALSYSEKAVSLAPQFSEAHRIFGEVMQSACRKPYAQLCLTRSSAAEYREAIRVDGNNVEAHVELAELLENKHKTAALQELRVAEQLAPTDSGIHLQIGFVLRSQKRSDEALVEFDNATQLQPNFPDGYHNRAIIFQEKGDINGAIREERKAVAADPLSLTSRWNMYNLLKKKGDIDGGIAQLREAVRLNPDNNFAVTWLADALVSGGDLDGAIEVLRQAIVRTPNSALYHMHLAQFLDGKGDFTEALSEYQQVVGLSGDDPKIEKAMKQDRARLKTD